MYYRKQFLLALFGESTVHLAGGKKGKTVIKYTQEVFNSRLVFILLSRSIKFHITMDKKAYPVNFSHQGLFYFSVISVNGNKYFPA